MKNIIKYMKIKNEIKTATNTGYMTYIDKNLYGINALNV